MQSDDLLLRLAYFDSTFDVLAMVVRVRSDSAVSVVLRGRVYSFVNFCWILKDDATLRWNCLKETDIEWVHLI
jgi:hypothetical protein